MRLFMKLKRSVKFIIPAVVVVLIVVAVADEQRRCRRKYCRKFNERRIILRVQQ